MSCCGGQGNSSECCRSASAQSPVVAEQSCCQKNSSSCSQESISGRLVKPTVSSAPTTSAPIVLDAESERVVGDCPSQTTMAGLADVCKGCPGQALCKSGAQGEIDSDLATIKVRMGAIKHKLLILSGKGGVGKSTIAANLSIALSRMTPQSKVGLMDVDVCGPSCSQLMNVHTHPIVNTEFGWKPLIGHGGVKVMSVAALLPTDRTPVIWRGPRKTHMIKQFMKDVLWGKLDYLVFDTPPGTSDEHMTVVNCLKDCNPDGAIIVMTNQNFAVDTIRKEITFCRKLGVPILGLIENMSTYVCPCCQEVYSIFDKDAAQKLAQELQLPLLGSIPIDQAMTKCGDESRSIFDDPACSASAALFHEIASNLTKFLA